MERVPAGEIKCSIGYRASVTDPTRQRIVEGKTPENEIIKISLLPHIYGTFVALSLQFDRKSKPGCRKEEWNLGKPYIDI